MNHNFKEKVNHMLRQTKNDQWMKSRMPKVKKKTLFFSKRVSTSNEETSNLDFYQKNLSDTEYDAVNHNLASQLLVNEIK